MMLATGTIIGVAAVTGCGMVGKVLFEANDRHDLAKVLTYGLMVGGLLFGGYMYLDFVHMLSSMFL